MRAARRFMDDESGMTLGLAMIMIVLIGVMGAGLLAFANRDINTVVEENRGQRAFEMADAGVGVAKRQLISDCAGDITCIENYDDFEAEIIGVEDIQWSWTKDGVTLDDLDGDGTTSDSVNVTIDYNYARDAFKVISTGTYGVAKRKIEAILKGTGGSFGGEGIGHPLYYTPSSITIEGDPAEEITLSGMSMFTQGDIIFEGVPASYNFKNDVEQSGVGIFHVPNTKDALGDWDSTKYANSPGNWNTIGRKGSTGYEPQCQKSTSKCERPGLAAEGKICSVPANSEIGECRDPVSGESIRSIADGVYGYDCTTGAVDVPQVTDPITGKEVCPDDVTGELPRGNNLTFLEKQQVVDPATGKATWGPNQAGTLSYPFPLLQPKEARLKRIAQEQQNDGTGGYYYRGCNPPWTTIFGHPEQDENDVIFIDAGDCVDPLTGEPIPIEMSFGGTQDGIMVVWCGDVHHTDDTKFRGILMSLNGDGSASAFQASSCDSTEDDGESPFGVYTVDDGSEMWGWLYAEGGTETRSGITFKAGTTLHFRSGADWAFLDDAFSGTPPTGFAVQGWRELYE
jgi:hypothetical protein